MPNLIVTTSWDDGHVLDLRVAELLSRYRLAGTFYVAPRDREFPAAERLTDQQVRELARSYEIGAHTMTHPRLTQVDDATAEREMTESKRYLERLTRRPVTSFCYPGGAHHAGHRAMAARAGFTYVRTVGRFLLGRPADPMEAATTVHAYRHWSDLWQIARFARFNPRKCWRYRQWDNLAMALFDRTRELGGVFHLWGHSWEIDRNGDWDKLERVMQYISGRPDATYAPNASLAEPKPLTALITTPYFFPRIGGLEVYALNLAQQLERHHGWRVVVVTTTGPGEAEGVYEVQGLKVHRLRAAVTLSNTGWSPSWTRKLREIIAVEQPDVINAHAPVPGLAEATALAAGQRPFVLTWHAGSMKKGQFVSDRLTGAYEAVVLPWLRRRARTVICSSEFVRSTVMSAHARPVVVPPGVDTGRFTPAPQLARDTVLFVGSLNHNDQYKGLGRLLDAMAEVRRARPAARLLVVGDGNHRPAYEQMARERQVDATFTGALHGAELAEAFRSATLFALPTTNDSYPTVILEAMASGLPVVSMKTGDIGQMVEDGVTGSLIAQDGRQLGQRLLGYLGDHELAARHGGAGRERVARLYSWDDRAAATNQIFQDSRKPKIVQVVPYYPPHLGGMENVARELSWKLAETGYAVEVLTSRIGHEAGRPDTGAGEATPPGLRVRALPAAELLHTPIIFGLFTRLLRQPRWSVLHLHVAQALTPEITMLAAGLRRLPVVAHVHLDVEPSSRIGEIIFRPYKRIILRRVLQAARQVVVLSADQRDLMITLYGLNPERVSVIPNGVGERYFMPARQQPHRPLRLLYVGRLAVQKRPERLIETTAKLGAQIHLDIVGDGEDRAKLEALAQRHHLANTVFHGVKRDHELLEFYARADAFIIPSDKEGLPLVLLEAMAAGLPIIGSDVMGIRELIRGVGVLVADPGGDTFAAAIQDLIASPGAYARLSRRSGSAAAAFSWDRLAVQFGDLYRKARP